MSDPHAPPPDAKDAAQAKIPFDAPQPLTVWRHYKGGLYVCLGTGLTEDTLTPMVAYRSQGKGTIWFRTLEDWTATVTVQGVTVPRFRMVSYV